MKIESIDRRISKKMEQQYNKLTTEGIVALNVGNYDHAENLSKKQYNLLFEAQKEENRSIHKGLPLYNMGLAQFFIGNIEKTIYNILLAFIEDVLDVGYEYEDEAERRLAATDLRNWFLFDAKVMRIIKDESAKIKKDGKWNEIRDPNIILESLSTCTPVIATKVGEIPYIVKDAFGILYDINKNLESNMVNILNYFAENRKELKCTGQKGRNYVVDNFSWAKYGENMNEILGSVMKK